MAEYFQHSIKLIEIWLFLQRRITGPKMVYKDNEGEREGRNLGLVLFKLGLVGQGFVEHRGQRAPVLDKSNLELKATLVC